MSIEFICPGCSHTLRVPEDAAGKQARCPNCAGIFDVPGAAPSAPEPPPDGYADAPLNPYASPTTAAPEAQPLATGSRRIQNVPVEAGVVIDFAWRLWQTHLGLLVGVFVVMLLINFAVAIPFGIVEAVVAEGGEEEVSLLISLVGQIATNVVSIYLGIGQAQILLNLARGRHAEFGQLFGGGPRFWPVLGVSILFGIALFFGFIACIVPGILLALMWWPVYYVVVEDKAGVMDSFSVAKTITDNNWGTAFLLWLASLGITILGVLALCIGLLFALPLVSMIWVSAYLMMSGQIRVGHEEHAA